jgi:Uma2 family endonuclease
MSATATLKAPRTLSKKVATSSRTTKPRLVSWTEFENKYLTREDNFKYEWVNGKVETTERTMDQTQYLILRNLRRFFEDLRNKNLISGGLEAEIDTFFLHKVHRRPDICYFSEEQENKMAFGEKQVPLFVIEVISTFDQINKVHAKMQNYRDAGVLVVWHIFPKLEEIHVYTNEDLNSMTICKGEVICSANPLLPNFALTASNIFRKPNPQI